MTDKQFAFALQQLVFRLSCGYDKVEIDLIRALGTPTPDDIAEILAPIYDIVADLERNIEELRKSND